MSSAREDFDAAGRPHTVSDKLQCVAIRNRQTKVCRTSLKNWLGRKASNLRMPDPKTGALPLGDAPTSWPGEALKNRAAGSHRALIVAAPNRPTGKDAPTSLKFNRLNGALLRIPSVKNPEYR